MYKRHFLSHKPHVDGKRTWNEVIRAGQPIQTGQHLRALGQQDLSTGHQTSGQDTHRTDQSGGYGNQSKSLSGDQSGGYGNQSTSLSGDQSRTQTGSQTGTHQGGSQTDHSSTGLTGDTSRSQLHKESTPRSQDRVTQDSNTK